MKIDCMNCYHFTSFGPSMDNPYPEVYCSKHFYDFTQPPEPVDEDRYMEICVDFEMNRYTLERLKQEREKKLKRILKDG
jgi:hypothetical protein